MSLGDLFVPFNHRPVANSTGSGASTCPAGKYARVTVNLATTNVASCGVVSSTVSMTASGEANTLTTEIWIRETDEIDFTVSSGSSTTGSVNFGFCSGTQASNARFNGDTFATCRAVASAGHVGTATATSTTTGSSDNVWYAEEYNVLT